MSSTCRYNTKHTKPYRDLNPASGYIRQKQEDRELMVRLPNSTSSSYFNLLLPIFSFPLIFPIFLSYFRFSSISAILLLYSRILPLKKTSPQHYKNTLLSIGGSNDPIEAIKEKISDLEDELQCLKQERKGDALSLTDRLEIGREMVGIREQITALTNEKVELMKEKALAGMARNYLS
jgi:hypothetical protein